LKIIIIALIVLSTNSFAITFNEAIKSLQKHESIEAVLAKSKAITNKAELNGSWGDPVFRIAAKNFPQDSLKDDQTPMTGIEFGISQKISLTTKYGNIEDSFLSMGKAYEFDAKEKGEALTKALWEVLIIKRKITEEIVILKENLSWIAKILKVSKKLYANGKTSQQAILDIQIRKSEIESKISNKKFELMQLADKINYFVGVDKIENSSIPWQILTKKRSKALDNREMSLKEKLKAKEYKLKASKLNYVPDMNVSVGVTKRSNIDDNGDFIGASISFPLPFSDTKYSMHAEASQEKFAAAKNYKGYKREKNRDVSVLGREIKKIIFELNILKNKTIKFASNSRTITSKSYALGNSSYIELLQSELKLQRILMKKIMLEAKRDIQRTTLRYILGESLNE
jgi:hypothetical protein